MRVIKAFSKFKDLHRKSAHKNRKWITEGHKVYPNKTKTYGPSTSNFMPLRFKAPSSPVEANQLSGR